jgi:glycosyltransferase involved in cell wall biosynthesis
MSGMPRVSVLLPVRNGLPWIREALDSLAWQTLDDFEILALEDGSTDGTAEVLAGWPDDRLRVISTGGVGIAAALNVGLEAARAPLVARQDADDVSAPDRLEAQVAYLISHTDVGLAATVADYIDGRGEPIENDWVRTIRAQHDVALTPDQIRELMPLTCCITHGSIMARTGVLRAAGGYRQEMAPAEDYDLWLRLLPRTPIAKLPDRLYRYRVHAAQVSARARHQQLVQTLLAKCAYVRRLHPDLPSPARLIVAGSGRGAACYRAVVSAHGFETVPPPPALQKEKLGLLADPIVRRWALDACDALVVGDFADLGAYSEALLSGADAAVVRLGNFFVPRQRGAARRAA